MTACMMHVDMCVLPAPEEEVSREDELELETAGRGEVEDPSALHLQLHLGRPSPLPSRVPVTIVVNLDM